MRKKVFISSTCYDLPDVRAEIAQALNDWGYEPVYNESPDFPTPPGFHSHDLCINAVKDCDYYLLIIDKRFGGSYSGNLLKNARGKSITWCEAETAYQKGIPVFTFVRQACWNERDNYKKQIKAGNEFTLTYAEDPKVFKFIDYIVHQNQDNWVKQFEHSVEMKKKLEPWLEQAKKQSPIPTPKPPVQKKQLVNISDPVLHFTGRTDYLKEVTEWYKNPEIRVGCLEGFGGEGKSSITRHWFDNLKGNALVPERIFWWGFYKNRSLDLFLEELLLFLSEDQKLVDETKGSYRKMELVLQNVEGKELLLIFDGFEEMQQGGTKTDEKFGCCTQHEMRELLRGLCNSGMKGLCLVTTRSYLNDIKSWEGKSFAYRKVEHLSPEDGIKLLKRFGVKGDEKELEKLVEQQQGHSLGLTLLATMLVKYFAGDVTKATEILPFATNDEAGGKARRILDWYDRQLSDAEGAFLKIFSLFRREVKSDDFSLFTREASFNKALAGMENFPFRKLLGGLRDRLLISGDEINGYDAHPLVREYFASLFTEEEKRDCHEAIYRQFEKSAPENPKTLEEMGPLFAMVRHGCAAGLYDEVFQKVYYEKIKRRDEFFLTQKLGAWETALNLVREFLPGGNLDELPLVTQRADQSYLMNEAGLALQKTGRPQEAVPLYQKKTAMQIEDGDWWNASGGYQNLTDLQYRCGDLKNASLNANAALEAAEKVTDEIKRKREIKDSQAYRAYLLFLQGETDKAGRLFRKADNLEREIDPEIGGLYGLRGTRFAEQILHEGKLDEARSTTNRNLKICLQSQWTGEILRCHRIFGELETAQGNFKKAEEHLEEAFSGAVKLGMPDLEIEVRLARGRLFLATKKPEPAKEDAEAVLKLVQRTTFFLYEPDALNILARAAFLENNPDEARDLAAKAKQKADAMGYAIAAKAAEGITQ